jgi:CCR4-NOT transcription complex subunit 3
MQKQQELEAQQQQAELLKRQQAAEQQQREQQEAAAAAAQQQQLLQQQAAQLQAQQQAASGGGGGAALGGLLGSGSGLGGLPLVGGADASGASASTIGSGQPGGAAIGGGADATGRYLGGLQDSFLNMPGANETERQRTYQPKNPYPTPSSYPTVPAATFDNPAFYEKAGIDCLFFIFYYSQGTYQQYLAAKELKKQSWRFHKKYSTWFQRHEEPKITTDEYEEGTYVYFDFETGWSQRIKSDFRFEYSFLEDSLQ